MNRRLLSIIAALFAISAAIGALGGGIWEATQASRAVCSDSISVMEPKSQKVVLGHIATKNITFHKQNNKTSSGVRSFNKLLLLLSVMVQAENTMRTVSTTGQAYVDGKN